MTERVLVVLILVAASAVLAVQVISAIRAWRRFKKLPALPPPPALIERHQKELEATAVGDKERRRMPLAECG